MKKLIILTSSLLCLLCQAQDLNDSLIICMPMDNNPSDYSGRGNNGLMIGTLTPVAGHNGTPNSAYRFSSPNYIRIPTSTSINRIEQRSEVSISVWCRVNQWSVTNHVFPIIERYYPTPNDGWAFDLNQGNYVNPASPNDINFINSVYAATKWDNGAIGPVPVGNASAWKHYVLVYSQSGNFCKIYVNSVLVATHTPLTTNALFNTHNGDLIVGYSPAGDVEWANGDIDDLRLYDRPLSQADVNLLFSETLECTSTGLHTGIEQLTDKSAVLLNQNTPNPFMEKTIITYDIPCDFTKAQIIFIADNGSVVKTIDIKEKGKGTMSIVASDFTYGVYAYTLLVDGKKIITKKMLRE